MQGTLFIVAAASGAGKTSLVAAVAERTADVVVSISYVTRAARPGEQHGKNYFFIDDSEFRQMIADDDFLEYAQVFDNWYGTGKRWVTDQLNSGIDVILEIDWQGAQQVRRLMPGTQTVFVLPPSQQTLRQRLQGRGQDDETVIESRMAQAVSEMSHYHEFDYVVVNDDFELAVTELQAIIVSQRLSQQKQALKQAELLAQLLTTGSE